MIIGVFELDPKGSCHGRSVSETAYFSSVEI
jgi:hypothetical protein